jgi:hypothetical protein
LLFAFSEDSDADAVSHCCFRCLVILKNGVDVYSVGFSFSFPTAGNWLLLGWAGLLLRNSARTELGANFQPQRS